MVVSHAILDIVEKVVDKLLLEDLAVVFGTDTDHQQPNVQVCD